MNWRFLKKDFKSRIVVFTLVIVFLSSLVNGLGILWKYDKTTREVLVSRVHIEADIIIQNIAPSLLFDDSASAVEILSTFSADSSVLLATLQSNEGAIFASYQRPGYSDQQTDVFHIHAPVRFEGATIGTLSLTVSKNEIYDQNVANGLFLMALLCLVVLVAYILSRPIIRSLLVPLLSLHEVSEKIAQTRDYSLRAKIDSDDEVGRLSKMFNHMVEQIEHRDDMLEKQVGQRTTELEKLAEEFRFRAFHDSLTGLPNRALLNERFENCIARSRREINRFACLLLDLDDFKAINDTKGHEFGDELLVEVANRLKETVRSVDLVCRLGGDEFVILLNDLKSSHDVDVIARKILGQLNQEFSIGGEKIRTAVSIGGALYPDHGGNMSTIKRHADVAMYQAKDAGKNRFCLFSDGMQENVKYRLMIQSDLRPALENKQFEVYVQPKVNARDNVVSGCEALVRWHHPVEGFLTPDKFIPYAEEVGMILEIDYFVIRECCALVVQWAEIFSQPIPIAFNLSGRHFHDFKIVSVLKEAIKEFNIDPALLEVEITEAVLIQDPKKAQKVVHAVKALGLRISLDDFGTGYSSLNYLRTLPIDIVKLDRSFVSNINSNAQDKRLTRGIVSLAKGLNLRLVAEGVENESQVQTLLELGCSTMQGYYFLRPAASIDFLQWYLKKYSLLHSQKAHG